jgi:hypothetical protein
MRIKRTLDFWVQTVALALMVLPLWGLYSFLSSPQVVRGDSVEDAAQMSRLARQLSREIGKLENRGGFEIAAHVLSVHSKIPAHELLARGVKLKDLSTAAMMARITEQNLDDVNGYLTSGASIEKITINSKADKQKAYNLIQAALVGIQYNRLNAKNLALDIDGDGIPNTMDPDADNDRLLNAEDQDIDGDGLLNAVDEELTHLPRMAGEATGAKLMVIVKAFQDLAQFRLRLSHELREEKQAYQENLAVRF